jgi:hypothetical protein
MQIRLNKTKVIVFFFLIVLLGSFLRFYKLNDVPAGFNQDEAVAGFDAYSLLKTGHDHHGKYWPVTFQTFNDWTGHSFNYQLMPFVALMGLEKYSLRFAIALSSLSTLILLFLLSRKLTGSIKFALLTILIFSISIYSIVGSRWATPPNTVPFFITLMLYLFYLGINRERARIFFWAGAGIITGISAYSYPSVEGFLPLWLISVFLILFFQKNRSRKIVLHFIQLMFLALLTVAPLVIDHINRPYTLTNKVTMTSVGTQTLSPVSNFITNYFSFILPFHLFVFGDGSPARAIPGFGYELTVLGIFYSLGLILLFFNKKYLLRKYPALSPLILKTIMAYFLLFPVIPSLFMPPGNFQKSTYIIPFFVIVSCFGIEYTFGKISKSVLLPGAILFTIIYMCSFGYFLQFYFGPGYRAISELAFQNGMDRVIKYTSENENKYKGIIIDNVLNQPYIYVLFHKKEDPSTLDYGNFKEYNLINYWLTVKRMKKYYFAKISETDLTSATFIKSIYSSPSSQFEIYEKNSVLLVKYKVSGNIINPEGYMIKL